MTRLTLALALVTLAFIPSWAAEEAGQGPTIHSGSTVGLEYTLKDDAGVVLDTNRGQEPLTYTQGQHEIIAGLEKALEGMRAGEEKQVTIPPAEGYGSVDPGAQAEIDKDLVPPEALSVGRELVARSNEGTARVVRIKEIKDKTVILDLNHPLAGKTLHFDVRIVSVRAPAKN